MAATLTAIFELIDKVSDKMDAIANSGSGVVDQWQRAESVADSTFDTATRGAQTTAQAARSLGDTLDDASQSFNDAADAADYWTDKIGNYDKSAMEAIYSTQELVEMGFKTEDALKAEAAAAKKAEDALDDLDEQTEETGDSQEEMGDKGADALAQISSTLASVGIVAGLKEIAGAAFEVADGFTEAEKIVTGMTGATGPELDSLMESAERVFSSSHAENLQAVATAMASVRRSTGLVGDELEQATSAGLALEETLGYDVAETSRTASSLMKNFGLTAEEAYNIITAGAQNGADKNGDLLDVLNEYSAQYAALGLSADQFLTSLVAGADAGVFSVDKVGDAVKEFNIRAKDGSDTSAQAFEAMGMNADEMTARFAAGGETASAAFFEVVNALNAMEDPVQKNAAAVGLFGTMYEDLEANVLPVLSSIEGGTIDVDNALATVTDQAGSLSDNWQEASNSVSTAFSTAVEPAVSGLSNGIASVVKNIGDFLQEHPAVTKAITAIGVGLAAVVVGITGVVFVTQVAIPAVTAFGVALNTALGPIGWVALAITGVVAAATAMVALFQDSKSEYETWTASTKKQYDTLQDLNAEYETACETYGETSEEALRLRYEIDDLSESFEANKQTVEEFTAEVDALIEKNSELISSYEESMETLDQNEIGTLSLVQKLEDLASQTNRTVAQEEQLKAVIAELNSELPDLALSYDDVTDSAQNWVDTIRMAAEAQAAQERQAEQQRAYVDLLKEQANLEEEIAKAEENLRLEQESFNNTDWFFLSDQWIYQKTGWDPWNVTSIDEYEAALADLQAAYAENQAAIAEIEGSWEAVTEETVTYEDAVSSAISSVQSEVTALAEAYDTAYESARTSIDGQIGLFDTMATETETSVSQMQSSLESQVEYLNTYSENLRKAAEYGLDEGLIASLSDGSAESAGYLNAIIENIEALGSSTSEAQQFVDEFNATFSNVEAAKDEFAGTVASMETDFDAKMTEIEGRLDTAIDNMNMDTDAAAAAKATMSAYTQAIRDNTRGAVSAAEAAAAAVAAALDTSYSGGSSGVTVPGHAAGTTDAEDVFVAGENGPELIVGSGGSTVFPADETRKIIAALDNMRSRETGVYLPAGDFGADLPAIRTDNSGGERKVYLEIAGKGSIQLAGGKVDEETLIAFLYEYLKPVLAEVLVQEIFEEGDQSYEY